MGCGWPNLILNLSAFQALPDNWSAGEEVVVCSVLNDRLECLRDWVKRKCVEQATTHRVHQVLSGVIFQGVSHDPLGDCFKQEANLKRGWELANPRGNPVVVLGLLLLLLPFFIVRDGKEISRRQSHQGHAPHKEGFLHSLVVGSNVLSKRSPIQDIQALDTGVQERYRGGQYANHRRASLAVEVHHLKRTVQCLSFVACLFQNPVIHRHAGCRIRCFCTPL